MHVYVSGRMSLDLLGTLKWRHTDGGAEELLGSASDVRAWFAGSTPGLTVTCGPDDVDRVRVVRESLYRTFVAARARRRPGRRDVDLLNEVVAGPGPQLRLATTGSLRRSATVEQGLTVVVHDAFDLLAGGEVDLIRDCANPRCSRLFLDTSRGRTRRWCGMSECGNAAKVAAFRARQRD